MTSQASLKSGSLLGTLLVLAAAFLWGTTGTSQALAPENSSPQTIGALRLITGGATLALIAFLRGGLRTLNFPFFLVVGAGFFVALYQVSFFSAVKLTGVAAGTIVGIGSSPIFAGLLDFIFFQKKPGSRWYVSTLLAISGCTILVLSSGEIHLNKVGISLALVAGFSYSAYALALKELIQKHSAEEATALVFCAGAILLSPILFTQDISWILQTSGWVMMVHLGIFATALSYYLFAKGLELIPVSSAVTLSLAEPLTAAVLGVIVVGERLSLISWSGLIIILSGILVLMFPSHLVRKHR